MHEFLMTHRSDLIQRCAAKAAQRPMHGGTAEQLRHGIPMFLDQLRRTLRAEQTNELGEALRISGRSGGNSLALSEIGMAAVAHGEALQRLGYTVDEVVHGYGDLCQAITDLAFECDVRFEVAEFRTLTRCLDNAVADAVAEFSSRRDRAISKARFAEADARIGLVMNELRNALCAAMLATDALELGNLPVAGVTGSLLKRNHATLDRLLRRSLDDVRVPFGAPLEQPAPTGLSFVRTGAPAPGQECAS